MGERRTSSWPHLWEGQALRTTQTYSVSPMGGSSPPDYPDLLSVTHGRVQPSGLPRPTVTHGRVQSSGVPRPTKCAPRDGIDLRTTQNYPVSPVGGSSPLGHPDLTDNRHEDGAKGGPGTQRLPLEGPVPRTI
jgi:hypothetical protein